MERNKSSCSRSDFSQSEMSLQNDNTNRPLRCIFGDAKYSTLNFNYRYWNK